MHRGRRVAQRPPDLVKSLGSRRIRVDVFDRGRSYIGSEGRIGCGLPAVEHAGGGQSERGVALLSHRLLLAEEVLHHPDDEGPPAAGPRQIGVERR